MQQRHYKSLIVSLIAITTLALMLLDRTSITPDESVARQEKNFTAPDVTFSLLDGGALPLRSLAGHKIYLHFWASWCIPCRTEFGSLLAQMEKEDSNTRLLAVSGDKSAQDANRFLAPYRRDFKALFASGKILLALDPNHALSEGVFQTFQYPETIIINPDLTMSEKISGPI